MPFAALLAICCACDDFSLADEGQGELFWNMDPVIRVVSTRAHAEIPDTNDFLLKVSGPDGKLLYDGLYGDSPESLIVKPGNYTLSIRSGEFEKPEFDSPQYGDDQEVAVKAGESVHVTLMCRQVNSGVRLKVASSVPAAFPDGALYLSSDDGKLLYSYVERRIAYFKPGGVSLIMRDQGKDDLLLTRELNPSEVLTLNLSAPGKDGEVENVISVAVDTAKIWTTEDFVIGGENGSGGSEPADAVSVSEASTHVGEKDVWVYGYIVGGDLTSAGKTVKTSGITKATHLAIAARSSVTTKSSCVAVELPKGSIRDSLNLVDHPNLIGTRIFVKGNVVASYFGTTGLKGTSDYLKK